MASAKSTALVLGMPEMGDEESEELDMGAERETAAAEAFLKAAKGSDPAALVSAFRELRDACEASYGDEPEEE